jgi:Flp pilus assembly protein TadG
MVLFVVLKREINTSLLPIREQRGKSMFSKFLRDTRGNVATMFGIMIIPITCFAGVAMDYARATQTRVALQASIDATALILSRDIKKGLITAGQVDAKAKEYVNAQFNRRFAASHIVTAQYEAPSSTNGGLAKVSIQATSQVDTILSRLTGVEQMAVGTKAEIVWGIKRLEVALVLDNSGSMDQDNTGKTNATDNKMIRLKDAMRSLLKTLSAAALKVDDVRIAVVPYARSVKVGTDGAIVQNGWLDWSFWDTDRDEDNGHGKWVYRCTGSGWNQTCGYEWQITSHSNWTGCLTNRAPPDDALDTAPSGPSFPPILDSGYCGNLAKILPLTDIKAAGAWADQDLKQSPSLVTSTIGKRIAEMKSSGATNGAIGTAWGWHALTSNDPLPQASAPKDDLDKVIILMTDGRNTATRQYGNGSDPNPLGPAPCPECDTRLKAVCDAAKAAKIIIYTVRVLQPNESVLQYCASSPDKFNDVNDMAKLESVFTTIAQNLAKLRIAK